MEEIENLLEEFDKAVKRLAAPAGLIGAAYLVSQGAEQSESGFLPVALQVGVLVLSAISLILCSGAVTVKKISILKKSNYVVGAVGVGFITSYIALAVVAIALAIKQFV